MRVLVPRVCLKKEDWLNPTHKLMPSKGFTFSKVSIVVSRVCMNNLFQDVSQTAFIQENKCWERDVEKQTEVCCWLNSRVCDDWKILVTDWVNWVW